MVAQDVRWTTNMLSTVPALEAAVAVVPAPGGAAAEGAAGAVLKDMMSSARSSKDQRESSRV